jgi:adenylyltransferase/sulfurtransferase
MALSDAQIERYSRQILLPEIGGRGQERLLAARIALAGSGPAAAAAATLLGRAGIGALDLPDEALALPELSPDCRVERHRRLDDAPPPDVSIDLSRDAVGHAARAAARRGPFLLGTLDGTRASLLTLVGRPCIRCVPAEIIRPATAPDGGPLASSAALALGALAATEALRVLLLSPRRGRHIVADLATGELETRELEPTATCAACGSDA